ncbi:hypothetical protein K8I61_05550 [bacterium]|nr:hypothetical protein [bacterium]
MAIVTDFAIVRREESGLTFVSLHESLDEARALDARLAGRLVELGYGAGGRQRFFVGAYASDPMRASLSEERAGPLREPPYHADPETARVPPLHAALAAIAGGLGDLAASPPETITAHNLPSDAARIVGGNYRSSGIVALFGVARRIDGEQGLDAPLTTDRVKKLRAPFLAIAFFESATGRLVYFDRTHIGGKQRLEDVENALDRLTRDFPPAATSAAAFETPPQPALTAGTEAATAATPFFAPPSEIDPAPEYAMMMAVVKGAGGVPFSPTGEGRGATRLLIPGTPVRVIGRAGVQAKIVLRDGSVGFVPASSVYVRP